MYDLSIVIPAYNEEKKISNDIEAVISFFKTNKIAGQLVIVDDGSKDKTKDVSEKYAQDHKFIKIIAYKTNKGKGYALRKGMLEANGEIILFADAGLCVPFDCTFRGIELIKKGYDIALGSRRNKASKIQIKQPLYRQLGAKAFMFLIKLFGVIPQGVEDTQCGFKLFKKDVAHDIYKRCVIDKFMIDLEMLRIATKSKYKIASFPVEWSNDPDTRYDPFIGTVQNLLQILKILVRNY
ncbi:MAG: glycosyltransferase family 2 protein [Candidatus Melainabacteria bacterium]|nr:glycosyltransferase family 2 protein [Candidatus Melainabacteria bacterium]